MLINGGGSRNRGNGGGSSRGNRANRGGDYAITDRREQRSNANGLAFSRLALPLRSCSTRQLGQFYAVSDANTIGGSGGGGGCGKGQDIIQTRLSPLSQRDDGALRSGAAGAAGGMGGIPNAEPETVPEGKRKDVRRPRQAAAVAEESSGGLWTTEGVAGRGVPMTGEDRKNSRRSSSSWLKCRNGGSR